MKISPAKIPPFVDPAFLAERSGIDLSLIEAGIKAGVVPVTTDGQIAKKDAITLLRAAAKDAREKIQASAAPPPAPATKAQAGGGARAARQALNALQVQQRIGEVCDMLAQMIPNRKIRERLAARWGCTAEEVEPWITKAYDDLAKLGGLGKTARKDQLRDAFCNLYDEAMAICDYKSAGMALDRIAKIDAAYAAEKLDVGGALLDNLNNPSNIRDRISTLLDNPELVKKIEELTKS